MDFGFTAEQQELIRRVQQVVTERIYTCLHGRHDIAAQIVGASELGEPYDTNRNH